MDTLADSRNIDVQFVVENNAYGQRLKDLTRGCSVLWSSGTTFRNACDISVLYITRLLPSSPYHLGPILGESSDIETMLAKCTRNGLLTTSSEPSQTVYNKFSGQTVDVKFASVEFCIKTWNEKVLKESLTEYDTRFILGAKPDTKFSCEFGPSYVGEDKYTLFFFLRDNEPGNEMFEILSSISSKFNQQ